MLPAAHRLRRASDFERVLRGPGAARAGSDVLVVHCALRPDREGMPVRVGFVVSKAVGNAVTRNLVKRRLRECLRARTSALPTGLDVAVRAQPAAARVSFADLDAAVDRQLTRAVTRCLGRRPGATRPAGPDHPARP